MNFINYFRYENTISSKPVIFLLTLTIVHVGLYWYPIKYGFWAFDDGAHLGYVAKYNPWQYFFIPEVTVQQSGANLTPWNAFFYDINLFLFGFNPQGFYLHQSLVVLATAWATFYFLRRWIQPVWAFSGALLFLVGAPCWYLTNQIMTGHYTTGLLFAVLVLYFFTRALEEKRWSFVFLSAIFYILSVTCKEVYVPLPGILLFLPLRAYRERILYLLPFAVVALCYLVWRYKVFGMIVGGYEPGTPYSLTAIYQNFRGIPLLLFGRDNLGKIAILVFSGLFLYMVYLRKINWLLLLSGTILLILPILPLTKFPGINFPDRYLFFIWWGLAVLIVYMLSSLSSKTFATGLGILLVLIALKATLNERDAFLNSNADYAKTSAVYRFILENSLPRLMLVDDTYYFIIGSGMIRALEKFSHPPVKAKTKLVTRSQLRNLKSDVKNLWGYDNRCRCMKNISNRLKNPDWKQPVKLIEKPLAINFMINDGVIQWTFGPYKDGQYQITWENDLYLNLPKHGKVTYTKPIDVLVRYKSPEGWYTASPWLKLDAEKQSSVKWNR